VFRAIFRACYARFRQCASKEKYISRVSLEANPGRQRKSVWGMKNEEYIADFCLISRRTLSEYEYTLFKFHYLLGADWKLCSRKMNLDRAGAVGLAALMIAAPRLSSNRAASSGSSTSAAPAGGAAAAACFLPVRRAIGLAPAVLLRSE